MAVGLPSNVNYVYDLRNGALLSAWGGNFIDATQMWDGRGEDQTITALGGVMTLAHRPSIAKLTSSRSDWPDSIDMESQQQRYLGYHLTPTGLPVFEYQLSDALMQDQVERKLEERSLTRTITVASKKPQASWYCLVAEGNSIKHLPDGSYSVDDHYYITLPKAAGTTIERQQGGQAQLVLPIGMQSDTTKISYTIVW